MGTRNVRIDSALEDELQYIQEEMKKRIADLDFSKPQASKIAARILNERRAKVDTLLSNGINIKKSRGRRAKKLLM